MFRTTRLKKLTQNINTVAGAFAHCLVQIETIAEKIGTIQQVM